LENLSALAFPEQHPFHHSLIGSMEDLNAASLDDIRHFFGAYYTPDNAVLSIAGDFDATEVKKLVEEYFGVIPRGRGKPPLASMELPSTFGKPIRLVVTDQVALPRLYLSFRSPIFGSDAYYAASVCGAILGMRRGSRLHRLLVRERQIAANAAAFTFDLAKGSDLLVADVTGRPETSPEKLEEEVGWEIDRLVREGVAQAEVDRATALIETDMVSAMQSASERADKLSMFATFFGEPRLLNEQSAKYRSVTVADVNEFAQSRLGADNRATLLFVPENEGADTMAKLQSVAA
jgi:predicted Zn-dependent peptidase